MNDSRYEEVDGICAVASEIASNDECAPSFDAASGLFREGVGDLLHVDLAEMDREQCNRLLGAVARINRDIEELRAQADAEHALIDRLLADRLRSPEAQVAHLMSIIRPVAERLLKESGKPSIQLLRAKLGWTRETWTGAIPEEREDAIMQQLTEAGLWDAITPTKVIPATVKWGDLKRHLELREDDGTGKYTAVLTATGEPVEGLQLEHKHKALDIKF